MTGVRLAAGRDAAAIAVLEQTLFGADAWSLEQVAAELRSAAVGDGARRMLAADGPDDVPIGYAVLAVAGDVADLLRIGVAPEAQRAGVARRLVEALLEPARAAGAERLLLEVAEPNAAARALYAALGFEQIHRRERYYRDGSAALVLQRALR